MVSGLSAGTLQRSAPGGGGASPLRLSGTRRVGGGHAGLFAGLVPHRATPSQPVAPGIGLRQHSPEFGQWSPSGDFTGQQNPPPVDPPPYMWGCEAGQWTLRRQNCFVSSTSSLSQEELHGARHLKCEELLPHQPVKFGGVGGTAGVVSDGGIRVTQTLSGSPLTLKSADSDKKRTTITVQENGLDSCLNECAGN